MPGINDGASDVCGVRNPSHDDRVSCECSDDAYCDLDGGHLILELMNREDESDEDDDSGERD